jgi:hypothetical protein
MSFDLHGGTRRNGRLAGYRLAGPWFEGDTSA